MKIKALRELSQIMAQKHTVGQKLNYCRYLFSPKREVLGYDPVTISIVATGRCTLSCDMCPTHSRLAPKDYEHAQKTVGDLRLDSFRDMVDRFRAATTIQIIGSGEPLLNHDFFDMVDYASGKRMKVKTFSNGTTIRHNIEKLLASRLDGITISLNGHNSAEFARMTGMPEDTYREIYEATGLLIEGKKRRGSAIKVKLSFIIDRHNYMFIPEMVDVGLKLGADHIFFCNFLPSPYDGLRESERVLISGSPEGEEVKRIFSGFDAQLRKRLTPPVLVDTALPDNLCKTHFSQIRFDGDGNVSSCSMMLLNMSGHGKYDDDDVWNNDFFRQMRRAFLSRGDRQVPDRCRVCPDNKGVNIER
jgi:MoaA/NifB/PqqE/SkfB family radical SAM enzyme